MFRILAFVLLLLSVTAFSQTVSGVVTDEDQNPLPAVMVFNMQTQKKAYTDINGQFTTEASPNQELRFIRQGFYRSSKTVQNTDFSNPFAISLVRMAAEIEEVKVTNLRLTGNLDTDARNLTGFDKVAKLQSAIGIPTAPEKPREKVADAKEDILKPLLRIPPMVNVQAVYDVISGKAKKKKRLFRYEDLQDNIAWIRERIDDDYFTKMGIPEDKISEFLQFSIGVKPDINKWIRAKNLSRILFDLEETFPKYLNR